MEISSRVGWIIVLVVAVILAVFLYRYYAGKTQIQEGTIIERPEGAPEGRLEQQLRQIEENGGMLIIHFAN